MPVLKDASVDVDVDWEMSGGIPCKGAKKWGP